MRATVTLNWNNARGTLRIGAREGRFPGMTAQRTLRIRLMAAALGGRIQEKTVRYDGAAVDVRFDR
jgi:alpha-D-xyloside xylohydrolase